MSDAVFASGKRFLAWATRFSSGSQRPTTRTPFTFSKAPINSPALPPQLRKAIRISSLGDAPCEMLFPKTTVAEAAAKEDFKKVRRVDVGNCFMIIVPDDFRRFKA